MQGRHLKKDKFMDYLKSACCPGCMGEAVSEKELKYRGCQNGCDTAVVIDKETGYRRWYKLPKITEQI
jgi:hypothetical protein